MEFSRREWDRSDTVTEDRSDEGDAEDLYAEDVTATLVGVAGVLGLLVLLAVLGALGAATAAWVHW
ncbi:MAG TPA: hypothetical protein VK700_18575 [Steroidobacteraceae bacterium]|nr:hypothetical protein [Steroidobacteraceae bacterium]